MYWAAFSAAKVVNNVPGAKLGMNLLNDLKNGESLQTAILNGYIHCYSFILPYKIVLIWLHWNTHSGKEAIDFIPVNGPVKDLVMNGIAASEALKEKKTVKDIVTEGLLFTICAMFLCINKLKWLCVSFQCWGNYIELCIQSSIDRGSAKICRKRWRVGSLSTTDRTAKCQPKYSGWLGKQSQTVDWIFFLVLLIIVIIHSYHFQRQIKRCRKIPYKTSQTQGFTDSLVENRWWLL